MLSYIACTARRTAVLVLFVRVLTSISSFRPQLQQLIVKGELPCTKDEAATLAGIQLHIQEAWPDSPNVPPPSEHAISHTGLQEERHKNGQDEERNHNHHSHHPQQQQHHSSHPQPQQHQQQQQQQHPGSRTTCIGGGGRGGESPVLDSDDEAGGSGRGGGGDLTRCFRINTDSERLENLRHKKELIRSQRAQRITR